MQDNAEDEKEDKHLGNMQVEPEFNYNNNIESNLNQGKIPNNEIYPDKKNGTKTKAKNQKKSKEEEDPKYTNSKNKTVIPLKQSHKYSKKTNNQDSEEEEDKKIFIYEEIEQSNSTFKKDKNQQLEEENIININKKSKKVQKINEDNDNDEINIDTNENNINIHINSPCAPKNISSKNEIKEDKIEEENEDEEEEEIVKPSLTFNDAIVDNSSLFPTEYMNELWDFFTEKDNLNNYCYDCINEKQTEINKHMRSILVDWLISLQNNFFYKTKTLFLTINLIDRYLSQRDIFKTRFQLLGVTALFIAVKYNEIISPQTKEYSNITANTFDVQQILLMENELMDLLDFQVDLSLSLDFFGLLAILYKFNKKEYRFGTFLLEAFLLSLNCCKYRQRQIGLAVCSIILGLRKIQEGIQNNALKYYSEMYKVNYDIWKEKQLIIECSKEIYSFYENGNKVIYRQVYNLFPDFSNQ